MKSAHRVLDPAMPRTELNGVCALAVMTKAPRPGQVKTRLTPPLSPPEAAELNRCFLRDTTAAIAQASSNFARGVAVYTPKGAAADYANILPGNFDLLLQRDGTFGQRLVAAAEDLWNRFPTTVVFDHLGHLPQPAGVSHPAFAVLRRLLLKWWPLIAAFALAFSVLKWGP